MARKSAEACSSGSARRKKCAEARQAEAAAAEAPAESEERRAGAVRVAVRAGQFKLLPVDELVPYVNNARIHSEAQIEQLRASMREFGFLSPIVVDGEGNILAGHGRLMAAKAEGMASVPCVIADDLTEAQRKAYILADNRLAENATWDEDLLRIELEGLKDLDFSLDLTGFSLDDIAVEEPPETKEDDDNGDIPEECPHKPGDIFKLGDHLLVCGDCTDPRIVNKLQRGGGIGKSSPD